VQSIKLFGSTALCIASEVFDSSAKSSSPVSVAVIVMLYG